MNPIKVLEWKGMYPIKKILLVMIWLFGCFLCVAGIIIFISDNDVKNLLVGILFGIGGVVFFSPIKKYVLTTYHCVPEYSCAATPQIRQTGNRLSGLAETAYASLLAQCFV